MTLYQALRLAGVADDPFVRTNGKVDPSSSAERDRAKVYAVMRRDGMSYPRIARETGMRSHTTVMAALKKARRYRPIGRGYGPKKEVERD